MNYEQLLLTNYIIAFWDLPRYKTFITKNEALEMFDKLVDEMSEFRAFSSKLKMEINDYVFQWHKENIRISELEHDLMGFYQRRKNA